MATMIDKKPTKYQGEGATWDAFSYNLPSEVVVYNHREVNGREFDFCLLIKGMGLVIIEVKGWNMQHITRVEGVDKIYLTDVNEPVRSPKKQARSYMFALLNTLKDKYNVSPLVIDLVCYPFLSEDDYKKCRLDIVSENKFTLFKEDIVSPVKLGKKINNVYNIFKTRPHAIMDDNLFNTIRQHFEPVDIHIPVKIETRKKVYSLLITYNSNLSGDEIERLFDKYLDGTKMIIFVSYEKDLFKIAKKVSRSLSKLKIKIDKGNLVFTTNEPENDISINDGAFRVFNFEVYYIDNKIESFEIVEGLLEANDRERLERLGKITSFNYEQYFIEHASCNKNILAKAGAGTGKTYSMVSRIAYLCNKQVDAIVSLSDSIAMITFTNDARDNMKSRLKQMFINYYVLTKNPMHLKCIEDIEHMKIATIHKFAKEVIQSAAMSLGLGNEFSISSSDYAKEQIYEKYLNQYIAERKQSEPHFFMDIKIPLYRLKKLLMAFSNNLYNKSIDIKTIKPSELGDSISDIPYFNELIEKVIIVAENEYSQKLKDLNKVDLKECMILLNNVVDGTYKDKCNLNYKYVFIDEFQDTDDVQIASFIQLQKIVGFKLFVVGDLKQSIYRFRGATIGAFDQLHLQPNEWEEYTLSTNYRTDNRLLSLYNDIFSKMAQENYLPFEEEADSLESRINSELDEKELIAKVEYHSSHDTEFYDALFKELEHQILLLKKLEEKRKLSAQERTIAILVRENWQIKNIVKEAKVRGISIETKVGGDLYQLAPAIDFYKLIMALNNPREPLYLCNLLLSNNVDVDFDVQILYRYDRNEKVDILVDVLNQYYLKRMNKTWEELIDDIHNRPILMILKKIHDTCQPWCKYSNDVEKQRFYRVNYELVIEKIVKNYSIDYLTLNVIFNSMKINIVTKQEEMARTVEAENENYTILCTTIHKSKGMEYGTVILPYTNQRIDSFKKAAIDVVYYNNKLGYAIRVGKNKRANSNYDTNEEVSQRIKEESRVFYVALTRAIKNFVWLEDLDGTEGISWKNLLEV